MKKLLSLCLLMMVCCPLAAQSKLFVRVYDLEYKKINKGFVFALNDSTLILEKDTKLLDIPVKKIGMIKTKRSMGNNVLIGTLIGTTVFAAAGAATADPDAFIFDYTPAEGALMGTLIGAPAGAFAGAVSAAFKKSKTFTIDGDLEKWKAFWMHFSEKTGGEQK